MPTKKVTIILFALLFALSAYSQDISYGVINSKGEEIIPFGKYRDISRWEYGKIYPATNKNGLYGAIDFSENIVVPFEYTSKPFFYRNYILVQKNKLWGILDNNGNETQPPQYYHLMHLTDRLIAVMPKEEDNSYGVMDIYGHMLIPPRYEYIYPFNDTLLIVRKEDKDGLINTKGEEIIPCQYNSLWNRNPDYILAYSYKENNYWDSYSIFDLKGNKLTTGTYRSILYLSDSTAIVDTERKNFLMIQLDGKDTKIKDIPYDDIKYLENNNLFAVMKKDKWAFMSMSFEGLTPFEYGYIAEYYGYDKKIRYEVKKDDKYALLDEKYKVASPYLLENNRRDHTGKYFIDKDEDMDRWMVVDQKGKIVLESNYQITSYIRNGSRQNFAKFRDKDGRIDTPYTTAETRIPLPENWVVLTMYDEQTDEYKYSIYDVKRRKTMIPYYDVINSYHYPNDAFVVGKKRD
jgi:hypothetical protein